MYGKYTEIFETLRSSFLNPDNEQLRKQAQTHVTNFIRTFVYESSVLRKVFDVKTVQPERCHLLPNSNEPHIYIDIMGRTNGKIVALGGPGEDSQIQPERSSVAFKKFVTEEIHMEETQLDIGTFDLLQWIKNDFVFTLARLETEALFNMLDAAISSGDGTAVSYNAGVSFNNFALEYETMKIGEDVLIDKELPVGLFIMHEKLFNTMLKHGHDIFGTDTMRKLHENGLQIFKDGFWGRKIAVTRSNQIDHTKIYVLAPEDYLGRAFLYKQDAIYWQKTEKDWISAQSWEKLAAAIVNTAGVVRIDITYS